MFVFPFFQFLHMFTCVRIYVDMFKIKTWQKMLFSNPSKNLLVDVCAKHKCSKTLRKQQHTEQHILQSFKTMIPIILCTSMSFFMSFFYVFFVFLMCIYVKWQGTNEHLWQEFNAHLPWKRGSKGAQYPSKREPNFHPKKVLLCWP
jgi:hypothetical protein